MAASASRSPLAPLPAYVAEGCRRSLARFVREAFPVVETQPLEWGKHLDAMTSHIQWQLQDRGRAIVDPSFEMRAQNLVINVPPRCLKTVTLTLANVWAWLHWPDMRILYLSANPRVAIESARMARDLILSPWFQGTFRPRWRLRLDRDAITSFGNTAKGSRVSRGLESTVTGEGADWQCIDDPHDVRDSRLEIEKAVAGYKGAVANRVNNPRTSIRTAIMQRVHELDWTAQVALAG